MCRFQCLFKVWPTNSKLCFPFLHDLYSFSLFASTSQTLNWKLTFQKGKHLKPYSMGEGGETNFYLHLNCSFASGLVVLSIILYLDAFCVLCLLQGVVSFTGTHQRGF